MLKRKIEPLDIREMDDCEIRHKAEVALKAFIEFWEQHGSILLTRSYFNPMKEYSDVARKHLEWLEGV